MARTPRPDIQEKDLHGFKHFKLLLPVMQKLHDHGCQRDKAGNRRLHYDQYAALILLYFFNPIVTSLRGIQQASQLQKVQRLLGCQRAALGSLSLRTYEMICYYFSGMPSEEELLEHIKKLQPAA